MGGFLSFPGDALNVGSTQLSPQQTTEAPKTTPPPKPIRFHIPFISLFSGEAEGKNDMGWMWGQGGAVKGPMGFRLVWEIVLSPQRGPCK